TDTNQIFQPFPTRRSSDLTIVQPTVRPRSPPPWRSSSHKSNWFARQRTAAKAQRCAGESNWRKANISSSRMPIWNTTRAIGQERSEEHTSELQSHLNLVCR